VSGIVPLGSSGEFLIRNEERALVHYEPFRQAPFSLDADVAAQTWFSPNMAQRPGSASRPVVLVRQLEAAYGAGPSARAAAGRLRYASSTLGMLDGVRLRSPTVGGFALTAFGGLVADPLTATPSSQASRFGGEVSFDDPDSEWRPHLVVGGHASRFMGAIDERRLNSSVDLYPEFGRMGLRGEVSFFDKDNPWGAAPVELTSIDADVGIDLGIFRFGAAGGMHRPERSRWLASFFPPEWLCVGLVGAGPAQRCTGGGAVYTASADVGARFTKLWATAGGSAARPQGTEATQNAAFANVRLVDLIGKLRIDAGAMTASGSFIRTIAGVLSPGVELLDGRVDASLRYRPAITRYLADTGTFIEHDIGPSLWLVPMRSLEIHLDGDWIRGRDLDVVLFQTAVGWRPGI
jgi:hypothetical protein